MRIEQKRGPFRIIDIFFEDLSLENIRELKKKYARITILHHHPQVHVPDFQLRQKLTPNIYLQDGMEAVFRRFRDTVRNEIHRTKKLPGFTIQLPDICPTEAYEIYRAFELSQKRSPISKQEFNLFTIVSARWKKKYVSGITFYQSENVIRVRSIFSSRMTALDEQNSELYKVIGYATKRLIYELCIYGITHQVIIIDLASINLTDPEKASIARFKSGFGAQIENEYQYSWRSSLFIFFEHISAMRAKVRVLFYQCRLLAKLRISK
ncbi:hypothetical protein IT408_02520 [Candidatus Uhrbacteria bacterium]|nr:hypothetical protein [Candidatus Uhrbacteria bacterium]